MPPVIELNNIYKSFTHSSWRTIVLHKTGRRLDVLRGASLTVNKGEIVILLGINGAGKTTLMKILASLITPDKGTAKIHGYDTSIEDNKTRPLIGLVNTNSRSFYWRLTGRQNLMFFAALHNLSNPQRKKRVNDLLQWLGLTDKADVKFMGYSSGQQQRLAICRALIHEPEILLMDEPTNSLDPLASAKLRSFVKKDLISKKNKAILWCTHDLQETEEMADQVAILHQGKIIVQKSLPAIKSLLQSGGHYIIKLAASQKSIPKYLTSLIIRQTVTENKWELEIDPGHLEISQIIEQLVLEKFQIMSVMPLDPPLEAIFENLTRSLN